LFFPAYFGIRLSRRLATDREADGFQLTGRDHLAQKFASCVGGVKGGMIVGQTNATGGDTANYGWSRSLRRSPRPTVREQNGKLLLELNCAPRRPITALNALHLHWGLCVADHPGILEARCTIGEGVNMSDLDRLHEIIDALPPQQVHALLTLLVPPQPISAEELAGRLAEAPEEQVDEETIARILAAEAEQGESISHVESIRRLGL
jgi:hypothetical protein